MDDIKQRIDELAGLMDEFGLGEAKLEGDDWKVAFRRHTVLPSSNGEAPSELIYDLPPPHDPLPVEEKAAGTPVTSPMNGIFYAAPSPSAAPFVTPGEMVTAGQVVGLIEAMKVFNEITAPTSGKVSKVRAESGQLVQPGDVLMVIEH